MRKWCLLHLLACLCLPARAPFARCMLGPHLPPCQASHGMLCRAFALEGRGIWHALSVSVAQQLIGPLRIKADFRFALDLPSSIPQVGRSCMYWNPCHAALCSWSATPAQTQHHA